MDGKAESMLAIVSPPGHVLQVFEVPVKDEPVVLNVSPDGGTLEVALTRAEMTVFLTRAFNLPVP